MTAPTPVKPRGRPKKVVTQAEQAQKHGLEDVNILKSPTEAKKAWLEEEVTAEFINLENPGMMVTFSYGPSKNIKKYTLLHGNRHRMPRKLMQHINSRSTPDYSYRPNGEGNVIKTLMGHKPRFNCREVFEEME